MKVIYITYDGLLDPLGRSQILPYLINLRPHVEEMQIISFEKKQRINSKDFEDLNQKLTKIDIGWRPHTFMSSKNQLLKIIDVIKFYKSFIGQCILFNPDIIHARGHPMAMFASSMKRIFKYKLIFDFRGMWPDEKIAKGSWDLSSKINILQYKFFKRHEKKLLISSDYIIFLTEKVKNHFQNLLKADLKNSSVIPCASDYSFFDPSLLSEARMSLINDMQLKNKLVLGYLGSIGPLYDFRGYLNLIKHGIQTNLNIFGLVITNNINEAKIFLEKEDYIEIKNSIRCISLQREDIPKHLNLFNFLVSFCKISHSIIGASPTKVGEALSLGVPVISNSGVGDIDRILNQVNGGIIVKDTSEHSLKKCVNDIDNFIFSRNSIRNTSKKFFDLNRASDEYIRVYKFLGPSL